MFILFVWCLVFKEGFHCIALRETFRLVFSLQRGVPLYCFEGNLLFGVYSLCLVFSLQRGVPLYCFEGNLLFGVQSLCLVFPCLARENWPGFTNFIISESHSAMR